MDVDIYNVKCDLVRFFNVAFIGALYLVRNMFSNKVNKIHVEWLNEYFYGC